MKTTSLLRLLILAVALMTPACGTNKSSGDAPPEAQPTTAVVTLASVVHETLPANTVITGYDVTVSLPAGVTVKSTTPPQTDPGVVTASGQATGSSLAAVYTRATGTVPGKVRILIVSGNGMNPGEFSKVTCNVAPGLSLTQATFAQPMISISGYDIGTNSTVDLTGYLSVTESVVIQ